MEFSRAAYRSKALKTLDKKSFQSDSIRRGVRLKYLKETWRVNHSIKASAN